ncbi:transcription initiation factor TFIID subunit 4B [Pelobates cultripes]|uniref:Transcription initiation factor TFIID subunit 4B n=1 Tax=Pelobates cultripes TaxID=61616 RepID=A0AAD1S2Q4_PELCU|nr:transcription initiation factor TFIID subunit 4B [Pelobates cultripes]
MQANQAPVVAPAGTLAGAPLVGVVKSTDPTITAHQAAAKPPVTVSVLPVSQPAALSAPLGAKVIPSHIATVTGGPRMSAPQQAAPPKSAQTTTIQLPANFQIPPGRSVSHSKRSSLFISELAALTVVTPLISLTPTFQKGPSVLQSSAVASSVVKVSSSLGCRQSTTAIVPTVVKIGKPSTPQTPMANQETSTIIIRARAPEATAASTGNPAAAPPAAMGVSATSVSSPRRTLASVVTPVTINACTSAVIPKSTVIPSTSTQHMPVSVKTFTSSSRAAFKALDGSTFVQTGATTDTSVKLTAVSTTTTVVGTCSPVISSIKVQSPLITPTISGDKVSGPVTTQVQAISQSPAPFVMTSKVEPGKLPQSVPSANSTEVIDNVKKCKNFLATLIKLASSSGPQSPTMGENVKNLVKNLLERARDRLDVRFEGTLDEPEEFTAKLYKELKSSPQPYLVPFLKKSLPALRRLMPNSQEFISQCGQQNTPTSMTGSNAPSFVKITATPAMHPVKQVGTTLGSVKIHQTTSAPNQPNSTLKTVNIKQVVVQQSGGGIVKHVTAIPPTSVHTIQKPGEKRITLNALIQAGQLPSASIVKQVTLPESKVISLQATSLAIKENATPCFREEDDINDVTSMAGVNLNEENACILATNSQFVGAVIRSCQEDPFLFTSALQSRILEIGKRHDIKELNSDVMNLVSLATQERLRGLIEKLTLAAQHRSMNYKQSDRYLQSSDVRAQLKFLEQLEQIEKQRKSEEEREMLLRAAKSRLNKEDPEQLRLKQKAKEMQQLELEQLQYREANLTALAAIGPRRKRPLDATSTPNGLEMLLSAKKPWAMRRTPDCLLEDLNGNFGLSKPLLVQRRTRVSLRDLIFCMEQDKGTRYSLSLYRALLK